MGKSSERKKNPWCKSGFPLVLSALSNFEFFYAFIILEILTGHKKKYFVNFLHVHRRNLVKEKKNARSRSGFPLLFLCILLQCSVLLFSRARNGHGRAHINFPRILFQRGSNFSEGSNYSEVLFLARFKFQRGPFFSGFLIQRFDPSR